ncbi:MAG TPA: glutamine amidotransferase [Actinomycetota bacterium]|nr:glutamine amidotransferase [Actinomycetota bacterium]
MSGRGCDLVVVHLYADLLRTYGDRGNVLALARRAEWRGFGVRVCEVGRGEPLPPKTDIVLMGGGTDRVQEIVGEDLLSRGGELLEAAAAGAVVIGICGGYQFLGRRYVDARGAVIEGLGILDVETIAGEGRIVGNVRAEATLRDERFELIGFENHGGRTRLGPDARPLATVPQGQGNNGGDRTEGAVQGTAVGTYLHGPVLPANPRFADELLRMALAERLGGEPLAPLDDALEEAAHSAARSRRR